MKRMGRPEAGLERLVSKRRSVRDFDGTFRIPAAAVRKIVWAGLSIPSPSGSMPVRIYQLESRKIREKIEKAVTAGKDALLRNAAGKKKNIINYYWRYTSYLFNAPLILAVTRVPFQSLLDNSKGEDAAKLTAGLSLFSMTLMAEALGLSSVILTAPLAFCPDIGRKIGLGEKETLCSFMAAGKARAPAAAPVRERRRTEEYFIKL